MKPSLHLLLIDDDELDRHMVVRALKQSFNAFEIEQSSCAAEGLQMAAKKHYDAILLDYCLPDQDGIEVLRALRTEQYEGMAVIMITHYDDEIIAEQCLESGAQDFLLKDEVSGKRLARAVKRAKQRFLIDEALRKSHEQLRILAERDALTGLANRRGFELALQASISRVQRHQGHLALLLLDLDGFKQVNDTYGHDVGDKLLVNISHLLRNRVRDGDFLCRLGGDEFVVLATDFEQDEDAAILAERIISAFNSPIIINDTELHVTTSIGIAIWNRCALDADTLFKCADLAMYRAKQEGRNQARFYSEQLHDSMQYKINIKRDIQHAMQRQEMRIHYQALLYPDGSLYGVEALLRWYHPYLGVLDTDEFLSAAEEVGVISELGNWVVDQACMQIHEWHKAKPKLCRHLRMIINLSPIQLRDKAITDHFSNCMEEYQIEGSCLELDITEGALIDNPAVPLANLHILAEMGISIAIDDYGSGYSSMQHLKLFPTTTLKIAPSFIEAIGMDEDGERMLTAMLQFGQALQLQTAAKGIEDAEQAEFCKARGCRLLQGYYFCEPVTAREFGARYFGLPALPLPALEQATEGNDTGLDLHS